MLRQRLLLLITVSCSLSICTINAMNESTHELYAIVNLIPDANSNHRKTKGQFIEEDKRITTLINAGADINYQDGIMRNCLLHQAIMNKRPHLVEILLKNEANPNLANTLGRTPLFSAIVAADISSLSALLSYGANVDQQDTLQNTPLLLAFEMLSLKTAQRQIIIYFLLQHDASIFAKNSAHKSPLQLATNCSDNNELAALLRCKSYEEIAEIISGYHGKEISAQFLRLLRSLPQIASA